MAPGPSHLRVGRRSWPWPRSSQTRPPNGDHVPLVVPRRNKSHSQISDCINQQRVEGKKNMTVRLECDRSASHCNAVFFEGPPGPKVCLHRFSPGWMGETNPTQWGKLSAFPCFSHHRDIKFITRPLPYPQPSATPLFHPPVVTGSLSRHPLRQNKHTAADSIDSSQRLCTNFLLIDRRPSPPPLPPVSFHHSSSSTHFRYNFSCLSPPVPCFLLPLFILTFASSFRHFSSFPLSTTHLLMSSS